MSRFNEVAKLAREFAERELARPQGEASPELLDALSAAAEQLKLASGGDATIDALVAQVTEIVAKRR